MAEIVGILNVTPDSFSDAGVSFTLNAALQRYATLVAEGAAVVDIGAESTRPGASEITPAQEWQRLEPVLSALTRVPRTVKLSIDTRHAETAARALALGVDWINDVNGLRSPAMVAAVKDSDCHVVVMHSLSIPADKTVVLPADTDVVTVIRNWFVETLRRLEALGVRRERIIFDPGIGFGKTAEQSLQLIQRADELRIPGVQLLFGHSRKSFLASVTQKPAADRDPETCAVSAYLAAHGVDYLRVHNVKANLRAVTTKQKLPEWLAI